MNDICETNHRGDSLNNCNGHGCWFEVSDVFPGETPRILGIQVNNVDWNHWKASIAFHLPETLEPVNLFHLSTDQAPRRPWRAGLEIGLRQGKLTACLNHGAMAQETTSRYEEVTVGPALTDGRTETRNQCLEVW